MDARGGALPHLLPVDPTLHWANPEGGVDGRDCRPSFAGTPGRYTGPVPLVTHVHGATHVGDESDGYSESWYLPAATDLAPGTAPHGSWYEFFAAKARSRFGVVWEPGSAVHQYPNVDRACTNWFHDHALGLTRVNVYAGLVGLYVVRGGAGGDAAVKDARTGAAAVLPSPAPTAEAEDAGRFHEVPLVIADRAFRPDGSFFYPGSREDFDDAPGPYEPESDLSPIWNPEFFGNTLTVNGSTWPRWTVGRRRYRVRVLNGCGSRFLLLDLGAVPGAVVHRIGNDGGFLDAPVAVPVGEGILLGPGERADLLVDFGAVRPGRYVVRNLGPDGPYSGGRPGVDFDPADPETTGSVLLVQVAGPRLSDPTTPAERLRLPRAVPLPAPAVVRRLALTEMMSSSWDGPAMAMLGVVEGDPTERPARVRQQMWGEAVSETPQPGVAELWEVYNTTEDAHPVHVHESKFEVVDRQAIDVRDDEVDMAPTVQLTPGGTSRPREPWESGLKDTVVAYPGEVTRIRVRFGVAGQYVWHCHILEHEDNEMMRPFRIGPVQPGQPGQA